MGHLDLQLPLRDEQREVTLLFADLRGCTELSKSLATDPLFCELVSQVLDCLTEAVIQHDGFVIDYYGDGLAAMWNAPAAQPAHAELACRAGLTMLGNLPRVAADWHRLIQTELRLGVGVHSGPVQVGNAGSKQRVKYGARGPNVHLASRVEAATKELHMPMVATGATVERLSAKLDAHRICRAQLPGLHQSVELYAISSVESTANCAEAWKTYGEALRLFEAGECASAAERLDNIRSVDGVVPVRFLRERIQGELSRNLRRRSTDSQASRPGGVIAISTK